MTSIDVIIPITFLWFNKQLFVQLIVKPSGNKMVKPIITGLLRLQACGYTTFVTSHKVYASPDFYIKGCIKSLESIEVAFYIPKLDFSWIVFFTKCFFSWNFSWYIFFTSCISAPNRPLVSNPQQNQLSQERVDEVI